MSEEEIRKSCLSSGHQQEGVRLGEVCQSHFEATTKNYKAQAAQLEQLLSRAEAAEASLTLARRAYAAMEQRALNGEIAIAAALKERDELKEKYHDEIERRGREQRAYDALEESNFNEKRDWDRLVEEHGQFKAALSAERERGRAKDAIITKTWASVIAIGSKLSSPEISESESGDLVLRLLECAKESLALLSPQDEKPKEGA